MTIRVGSKVRGVSTLGLSFEGVVTSIDDKGFALVNDGGTCLRAIVKYLRRPKSRFKRESGRMRLRQIQIQETPE